MTQHAALLNCVPVTINLLASPSAILDPKFVRELVTTAV